MAQDIWKENTGTATEPPWTNMSHERPMFFVSVTYTNLIVWPGVMVESGKLVKGFGLVSDINIRRGLYRVYMHTHRHKHT